jgi:hypothetical protein
MILETIRALADHLTDPTVGLGAKLATTPRDGSDPLPATPTIEDETRSFAAALGRPPATLPALTLHYDSVLDLDPRSSQQTRDGQVAVVCRYVVREANLATGTRDAFYVTRALERSLDVLPLPIARNGIELYSVTERQYGGAMQQVGDAWVILSLRVVLQVRETVT